jgi:hypothetical protein
MKTDTNKPTWGSQWVTWLTQRYVQPALAALRMKGQTEGYPEALTPEILAEHARLTEGNKRGSKATSKGFKHKHNPSGSKLARKAAAGTLGLPHGR